MILRLLSVQLYYRKIPKSTTHCFLLSMKTRYEITVIFIKKVIYWLLRVSSFTIERTQRILHTLLFTVDNNASPLPSYILGIIVISQ